MRWKKKSKYLLWLWESFSLSSIVHLYTFHIVIIMLQFHRIVWETVVIFKISSLVDKILQVCKPGFFFPWWILVHMQLYLYMYGSIDNKISIRWLLLSNVSTYCHFCNIIIFVSLQLRNMHRKNVVVRGREVKWPAELAATRLEHSEYHSLISKCLLSPKIINFQALVYSPSHVWGRLKILIWQVD